jgi:hypothetical protein
MHRLKSLPDYVEVLPGAFSGSLCGRRLSGNPSSTIGFERRHNRAFAMDDEDEFVRTCFETFLDRRSMRRGFAPSMRASTPRCRRQPR